MRNRSKTILLAGAAAGAMALGLSGPAMAFDTVNWDWEKVVLENVAIDGQVTLDLNPSGLVELEKMQIFIGDAIASSEVSNINNNQPSSGGNGTVSFTVDWSGTEDDSVNPAPFGTGVLGGPQATLSGDLSGSGDLEGSIDEGTDAMQLTATFTDIPVSVSTSDSYDALTELPEVISTATAVGNNQSIESTVAVMLHDSQFVFGDFVPAPGNGQNPQNQFQVPETGNTGFSMALALLNAGQAGDITAATIDASSSVHDILNATVDSTATAVANNASVEVNAATPSDAVLIGDYTQAAYANVGATSSVYNVSLNNYTNLGMLGKPIVNSVATAVGNNLSIKVTSPTGP